MADADASITLAVAVSAFGGTLVGFALNLGLDLFRRRFQLTRDIDGLIKEQVFGVEESHPAYALVITAPDEARERVLSMDVIFINKGLQADAVVGADLVVPGVDHKIRANIRFDEVFRGVTIEAYAVHSQRFRFILDTKTVGDTIDRPPWRHLDPRTILTVEFRTSRKRLPSVLLPLSSFVTLHQPDERITYLHYRSS